MATQDEFLDLVWEGINLPMQERWIENNIRSAEKDPNASFGDVGPALKRLLALGASRQDLRLIVRNACYETAFHLLNLLSDPGIDDNEIQELHGSLLQADPSGKEGRPGSAPLLQTEPPSKSGRQKQKSPSRTKPKPGKRKLLKSSNAVCFSPDGTLLATIGRGLTLWKCPEIEQVAKISTISNLSYVAFSPDSRLVAVKNTSGRIVLIDTSTHTTKVDFRNQADGEGSNILFADDGQHIIDASWKGSHFVRTLDGKIAFREVFESDMVTGVIRHPDGRDWFLNVRPNERLIGRTWPFKPGEYDTVVVPLAKCDDVAFSPDGHLLTLSFNDRGFLIHTFSFPAMETIGVTQLPGLGLGTSSKLRFSPRGRLLAVIGSKSQVVLNATTFSVISQIPIQYGCDVDFSPADPLMAVGSWQHGEVFNTTQYLSGSAS